MSVPESSDQPDRASSFAEDSEGQTPSLPRELWDLLRYNKKWWLIPILAVLLLAGLFIFLSGTVFAPFIYPLF